MAIIKCKMCGGDVELTADKTFGTCEFCGSTMTFPKVDDEQRAAAFNRGNHFRRIGEFDKALAVYERIVREDDTDAEAHWCCALCRFGIEYVEDPTTYEYIPTCHRASFDSFLEDVDYLAAVEYSEGITKRQYQKDGAKIAEVQRGILATSQNEEPFDVFICYKESDENGERTRDSLMAQDVYYQLTDQGYRVFFARITLEDMVGKQYEPYIFAALNSAKVMIVIGTKAEYMNAVWVKNEWSRFLAMMKKDRNKLLLPCYRDMDPYDMPEQLSVLQSYDMTKIGFVQDLIRGIKKVLDAEKKTETVHETVVMQQAASNVIPLLKRGNISLEDGDWRKADELFEEVLNHDPECAQAYIGKVLAAEKALNIEQLANRRIQNSEEATTEIVVIDDASEDATFQEILAEQNQIAEDAVQKYAIAHYFPASHISGMIKNIRLEFESQTVSRQLQMDAEEAFWGTNRELNRALKYANPQEKKEIEDARNRVISTVRQRLEAAVLSDAEYRRNIRSIFNAQVERVLATLEAEYKKASAKQDEDCLSNYNKMCASAETSNDTWSLRNLANAFIRMGDYKDCKERAAMCREKAMNLEKKNEERKAQIDTWKYTNKCAFCGGDFVGLFSKKCCVCGRDKSY